MMYSGDERLKKFAKSYHSTLASFCDMEWTKPVLNLGAGTDIQNSIDNEWKTWYEGECRRRTGYCIWVSLTVSLPNTC
jgi:enoyl reductase-like protein